MTVSGRWLAATCLILAPLSTATSGEPPTDCFGDPLPDGVAVRMGTIRFRHGGDLEFVGFLPDGKTILSFGRDDTLRWWDAASGKELRRWTAPAALGYAAPLPDRRVLAAQVGDDVVQWDAASGKELWRPTRPDACAGRDRFFVGSQAAGDLRRAHLGVERRHRRAGGARWTPTAGDSIPRRPS